MKSNANAGEISCPCELSAIFFKKKYIISSVWWQNDYMGKDSSDLHSTRHLQHTDRHSKSPQKHAPREQNERITHTNVQKPPPPDKRKDESEPSKVLFLTYSRSGSSFLGEVINRNKGGFYHFEPLFGIYSALYGIKFGMRSMAVFEYGPGKDRYIYIFVFEYGHGKDRYKLL